MPLLTSRKLTLVNIYPKAGTNKRDRFERASQGVDLGARPAEILSTL